MNEARIKIIAGLWAQVLAKQLWNIESAKLRTSIDRLMEEDLSLKETNRLLNEILSNSFLRKRMSQLFHKHEALLRYSTLSLEKTIGRRKEVVRSLRESYLAKRSVSIEGSVTIDCELGTSRVKEAVEDALEQYADEMFVKEFDKSILVPSLSEIEKTLNSRSFVTDCLSILVADFVAEAKGNSSTETLGPIVVELIGQLMDAGHDPRDLVSRVNSLMLPDSRSSDDRFNDFVSTLTGIGRSYTILTGLEDLRLRDVMPYRIADVNLYAENQDLSQILDKMPSGLDEIKDSLKKHLSKKVIAEIKTTAFGTNQAREYAREKITQAIDIVSLEDPNVVIREPREERQTNEYVFDEKMSPQVSLANRLELSGKDLDEPAREKTL